jgi:2-polyprenyl-6-methoxyphenol hydroxylase-like FAD-dependent oxidoreductase
MPGVSRAVIVGAGIGGLTTAIALRQAGVECVVLERREEPSRLLTGGGFMLWHNVFLALRQIKLAEQIADAGVEIRLHEFHSDRGRMLARWPVGTMAEQYGVPAVALRRSVLNTILMDNAGDCVRLGTRCVGYTQDADGVSVQLADGTTERGDVLIGADGLRSTVRDILRRGHDLPPRYAGYTAWQAITEISDEDLIPYGTFFNMWGRGGLRFLYCRLNPTEVYWDAITSDDVGATFDTVSNDKRTVLQEAYRHWPETVRTIIRSTAEDAILPIDIFDRPPGRAGAWGSGRVTLIGDAAHPMTLNLSQGAGQAIEDAIVLSGRLLAKGAEVPEVLSGFEASRRARVEEMVATSWQIGELGRWRNPIRCAARERFMRVFFGTVGFRQSYKLMMDVDL